MCAGDFKFWDLNSVKSRRRKEGLAAADNADCLSSKQGTGRDSSAKMCCAENKKNPSHSDFLHSSMIL